MNPNTTIYYNSNHSMDLNLITEIIWDITLFFFETITCGKRRVCGMLIFCLSLKSLRQPDIIQHGFNKRKHVCELSYHFSCYVARFSRLFEAANNTNNIWTMTHTFFFRISHTS